MSCASRLDGMAPRRTSNGGGPAETASWFHQSLEHLSQGWRKLNQFGSIHNLIHQLNTNKRAKVTSRSDLLRPVGHFKKNKNNKRNRCSSWYVEPYRPVPANSSIIRKPISEESLDFFDRFATVKERASRPRAAVRSKHFANWNGPVEEEAFTVQFRSHAHQSKSNRSESASPAFGEPTSPEDGVSVVAGDDVDNELQQLPQPVPRSRPRSSRAALAAQLWVWGPELLVGPEADKVYVEAVYSLVHAICAQRSSRNSNNNQTGLPNGLNGDDEVLRYLQRVFQFSDSKHAELLESVRQKPVPDVVLHLGVLQARHLKGKDVNGMSDPYCIACTSPTNRQTTSMKPKTLNPVWNETLQFAIKDAHEDILQLEVWDYDPDETVKEKMSRIGEVKDLRGMGILIKQIASASKVSAAVGGSSSSGRPASHQFLGQLHLPLKTIPLTGLERWYPLEGRDGSSSTKERGEIRLNLSLSASRTDPSAAEQSLKEAFAHYERLFRIIVETEIKANPDWRGKLPEVAEVVLRQMAAHRNHLLRPIVTDVCAWSVYASALHKRQLDFAHLLLPLIQRIKKGLYNEDAIKSVPSDPSSPEDLVNTFWNASGSMVEAALSTLRHGLRNRADPLASQPAQLAALLECLKELNAMGRNRSDWTDLEGRIADVITMGAADCCSRAVSSRKPGGPICDDDRLENSIRICQALVTDLKNVLAHHQEPFMRIWEIDAFGLVYRYYDSQLAGLVKPVVDSVTRTLKSVHTSEEEIVRLALMEASGQQDDQADVDGSSADQIAPRLTMGTALFELYLCLQQFQKLPGLRKEAAEPFKLEHFYSWFSTAVSRWLDIALYKALTRIGKAVNLDTLATVDALVRFSSSAVDTVTVFYQIKTFWEQLAWPDTEGALAFVIKIIDDINRCSLFYAEAIRLKMEQLHPAGENETFFISLKVCAAINSIIHVRSSIEPLSEEMGISKLCGRLQRLHKTEVDGSPSREETCNETRTKLTENAVDNINAKLDEIFYTIARRIESEVAKLINSVLESEFASLPKDRLGGYIYDQLATLNSQLECDVFERVLHIIHQRILQRFLDVVLVDVEKKRQPGCFKQWEELLKIINTAFCGPDDELVDDETLTKIRWLLKLHGSESADLIHQYRLERMEQTESSASTVGSLTVRAIFVDDTLTIEVLNGRNLKPMDSNGSADPYVKVAVLPGHHFPDAMPLRSKVHKNTLFPLFDETFNFPVARELQTSPECFVLFSVKDRDLIGSNELIGEAYLSFRRIIRGDSSVNTQDLEQIILPLSITSNQGSEILTVLEGRTWDKTAREFAKKERKRGGR